MSFQPSQRDQGEPVPAAATPHAPAHRKLFDGVVEAALAAHRTGTLPELVRRHPGAARWLLRRYRRWLVAGPREGLGGDERLVSDARTLLVWAVCQLRPDRRTDLDGLERADWIERTAWRPMLAAACQAGLLKVPDFRDRYRRREGESAVDNLCGLWGIGTSTFYRHLDRSKLRLVELLAEHPPTLPRRFALRQRACGDEFARLGLATPAEQADWHLRQARSALAPSDPCSALWHAQQSGDLWAALVLLAAHSLELAGNPETDAMLDRMAAASGEPATQFELALGRAALQRHRHAPAREQALLEDALRIAQTGHNPVQLAIAHAALGKFHEPRDAAKAFACYEAGASFLRDVPADAKGNVAAQRLTIQVRLAWLMVLRNDPRARQALDAAVDMARESTPDDDLRGVLEQAWGEFWRRAGDLPRAIASKHRALLIFQRLGDQRSMLATYGNLVSMYGETREFERAIEYARKVEAAAAAGPVDPEIVTSCRINLGAVHFWRDDMAAAIEEYERALASALRANLRLHAIRAHYNLAEAFYTLFKRHSDPAHERRADAHVHAVLAAPSSEATPATVEAARALKAEVLGEGTVAVDKNRLLSTEAAIHTQAMAEIDRQRALLALPLPASELVRARLAIVQAYQVIAQREYDEAHALVEARGLHGEFGGELLQLTAGSRPADAARGQAIAAAWVERAEGLLPEERRSAVIAHLLREGAINKSGYAELCGVSPATASKHLATLAERGLLTQTGKGPSTRYVLPEPSAPGSP